MVPPGIRTPSGKSDIIPQRSDGVGMDKVRGGLPGWSAAPRLPKRTALLRRASAPGYRPCPPDDLAGRVPRFPMCGSGTGGMCPRHFLRKPARV